MRTEPSAYHGFRFPAEVILWAVRWCLQFPVSYRDLERMLADRGAKVDHRAMCRWVQRFAPELEKRMGRHPTPQRNRAVHGDPLTALTLRLPEQASESSRISLLRRPISTAWSPASN